MGQKKGIILIILSILLIFIGLGVGLITSMNESKKEMDKKIDDIEKNYKVFQPLTETFQTQRKSYVQEVVVDLFYESVEEKYKVWKEEIDEYQKVVEQIRVAAKPLYDLCIGQEYIDTNTINRCSAYVNNYETVMNYFVKDINEFNDFIDEYKTSYETKPNEEIKAYELDKEKYNFVDINDDGKFIGKD